ncbi:hypothetical protein VTI28DRAFT_5912 [Corynascus sepedonium]
MEPSAESTTIKHKLSQEQTADSLTPNKMAPDIDSPGASNVVEPTMASLEKRADERHDPVITLETLPAELRDQILPSAPDLPTLGSLVHASPVLHAQYLSNRDALLRACVARELDGFFIDAHACFMSRVSSIGSPRTNEKITAMLDAYRGRLSGSSPRVDVYSVKPGIIRWLAAFHQNVARPLARRYSTWALANLTKASSSSPEDNEAEERKAAAEEPNIMLSRSEKIRIFRALYRYETYYYLFGRNRGKRRGMIPLEEINNIFFCLFDPWEAEALGCIDVFVRHKYKRIFDQVKDDIHVLSMDYFNGTVSRGLNLTVRLLAVNDHDTLVSKMQRCLTRSHSSDDPIKGAIGSEPQRMRRDAWLNVRDEAEQRKDPLKFTGDTVPPDGPPLAWVLLWGGTYANLYGEYIPSKLKQWGHVMWDERRWVELGAKSLVSKQWETAPELVELIEVYYGWRPSGR